MTLPRSSADRASAKYDFRHSFKSILPAMALSAIFNIALFVVLPLIRYDEMIRVRSNNAAAFAELKSNIHSVMVDYSIGGSILVGGFAVAIGVLFAFCAFLFLHGKKSSNFYLSVGIDRRTLFRNRVASSIIAMLGTVFIPVAVDVIINIARSGHAAYILEYGLFDGITIFSAMLSGFAIMSIAMAGGMTVVDSLISGAGMVAFSTVVVSSLGIFAECYLRGFNENVYTVISKYSVVNPLLIAHTKVFDLTNRFTLLPDNDDLAYMEQYLWGYSSTFTNAGYEYLSIKHILSALIWIAVSAVLIVFASYVLRRRKAENTGIIRRSHGLALFLAVEMGIFAGTLGANVLCYVLNIHISLWVISALIAGVVAFIATVLVLLMFSSSRRRLIPSVVCSVVVAVVAAVFLNGGLGYSTYVPDVDDVDYVMVSTAYINPTGAADAFRYNNTATYGFNYNDQSTLGIFRDKDAIHCVEETVPYVQDIDSSYNTASILYEYYMTDGSRITRRYDCISDDAVRSITSIAQTREYCDTMGTLFLGSEQELNAKFTDLDRRIRDYECGTYNTYRSTLQDGDVYVSMMGLDDFTIDNTVELRKALLTDLRNTGYSHIFTDDIDVLTLRFSYSRLVSYEGVEEEHESSTLSYPVYSDMTATIAYLKQAGILKRVNAVDPAANANYAKLYKVSDALEYKGYYSKFYMFDIKDSVDDDYCGDTNVYDDPTFSPPVAEYTDRDGIAAVVAKGRLTGMYTMDDYILAVKYGDYVRYRLVRAADVNI